MASGMFEYGIEQILRGNVDVVNDSISVVVCSTSYSPDLSNDQNQSDISDAYQLGETELDGRVIDGTAFNANSATISNPTSDTGSNAVVVFKDTGNTATSTLLVYIEVTSFTTDGTPIVIDWNADGIFEL